MKNRILEFPTKNPTGDTWQIAYTRFPGWVDDEDDGSPYRPWMVLAVSASSGKLGTSDLARQSGFTTELVQAAMDSLHEATGTLPGTIEVCDPELADALADMVKGRRIEVACREDLPLLAEPLRSMYRDFSKNEPYGSATEVPGVTIEHLRAFAEAAECFRLAAPWRHLESSDLIEVGAPRPAPNVRFACVMSEYGERGLALAEDRSFFETNAADSESAFDHLADRAVWSVTYFDPWEIPVLEHNAWLEHGLATDPDGRVPCAVQYGPKRRVRRASPKMLGFFEAMFRALAETSEDELDKGEWRRVVDTSHGRYDLSLSLPDVLSPPRRDPRTPAPHNPLRSATTLEAVHDLVLEQGIETREDLQAFLEKEIVGKELPRPRAEGPKAEAREIALEAMDTPGRRGIALARRALELDPDCAIALLALAERASDPELAVDRYREAVAAAERALDPEIFEEGVGVFWGLPETRPYMEARKGLADAFWLNGQRREAIEEFTEMLRLNPNDNQGVRERLIPALMAVGDDKAAKKLLKEYDDDPAAAPAFNRALAAFRVGGDTKAARDKLAAALEINPSVADMLLGRLGIPDQLPYGYSIGSVDEAVFYVMNAEEAWAETPDALDWLAEIVDSDRHSS